MLMSLLTLTNLLMLLILVSIAYLFPKNYLPFIALMVLLKSTFLETHILQMRTYLSKREHLLIFECFLFNTFCSNGAQTKCPET